MALLAEYRQIWNLNSGSNLTNLSELVNHEVKPVDESPRAEFLRKNHLHVALGKSPDVKSAAPMSDASDNLWIAIGEANFNEVTVSIASPSFNNTFPAVVDEYGACALHLACTASYSSDLHDQKLAVLRFLLSLPGALEWIHHQNADGLTPLMMACATRFHAAITVLLDISSDDFHINATNSVGCTALHVAIDECDETAVKMLVTRGAWLESRAIVTCDESVASIESLLSPIQLHCGVACLEYAIMKQLSSQLISWMQKCVARLDDSSEAQFTNGAQSIAEKPMLPRSTIRGIAESLASEGLKVASKGDIERLLGDVAGAGAFNDNDVMEVIRSFERASVGALVVCDGDGLDTNTSSPQLCQRFETIVLHAFPDAKVFDHAEFERKINAEGSGPGGVVYLHQLAFGGSTGRLPPRINRMLTDMVLTLRIKEPRSLFSSVSELGSNQIAALIGNDCESTGYLMVSRHLATKTEVRSTSPESHSNLCLWVCPAENGTKVHLTTFLSPKSFVRSLFETSIVSVVNFDEAVSFSCLTRDRFVLGRVAEITGMIPAASIFETFHSVVLKHVLHCVIDGGDADKGDGLSPPGRDAVGEGNASMESHSASVKLICMRNSHSRLDLLTIAITQHLDSFVSFLISSPNCNPEQRHLVSAAERGTSATFQLLFAAMGSTPALLSEIDPISGETPVTAAIKCGTCLHLTSLLKIASRALQHCNREGLSPLLIACLQGHESAVLQLISLGADLNERGRHGVTPLIAAIAGRNDRIVCPLVQSGAFVDQADIHGVTPLFAAKFFGSSSMYSLQHQSESAASDSKSSPSSNEVALADTVERLGIGSILVGNEESAVTDLSRDSPHAAVTLVHTLEHYFASIAKCLPELKNCPRMPAETPQYVIPVRVHALNHSPTHLSLLNIFAMCVAEVSAATRAVLLESDIRGLKGDIIVDMLFSHFVGGLRRLVVASGTTPPAEACLNSLSDELQLALATVHSLHRFVLTVQLAVRWAHADVGLDSFIRHSAVRAAFQCEHWKYALRGRTASDPLNHSPFASLCLPTSTAVVSIASIASAVLSEDTAVQDAISSMLDPTGSGWTTVFDFAVVNGWIKGFSNDGLSSLQYLLRCREIFLTLTCDELVREVFLDRSIVGYVICFGPSSVTMYQKHFGRNVSHPSKAAGLTVENGRTIAVESASIEESNGRRSYDLRHVQYRDVSSLVDRESSVLRTL